MLAEPQARDGNKAILNIYSCFHGNKYELHILSGRQFKWRLIAVGQRRAPYCRVTYSSSDIGVQSLTSSDLNWLIF